MLEVKRGDPSKAGLWTWAKTSMQRRHKHGTYRQRLEVIQEILSSYDCEDPMNYVDRKGFRAAVTEAFSVRFNMPRERALFSVVDLIGRAEWGLDLGQDLDGQDVVFLRRARIAVEKALAKYQDPKKPNGGEITAGVSPDPEKLPD